MKGRNTGTGAVDGKDSEIKEWTSLYHECCVPMTFLIYSSVSQNVYYSWVIYISLFLLSQSYITFILRNPFGLKSFAVIILCK